MSEVTELRKLAKELQHATTPEVKPNSLSGPFQFVFLTCIVIGPS